jgi:hypothetical protein
MSQGLEKKTPELDPNDPHLKYLYRQTFSNRRDNVSRIWDTLKFSTTIFTALLSAAVALTLGYFRLLTSIENDIQFLIQLLILAIAFCALVMSSLTLLNFRREYERVIEATAVINKIECLWGFHTSDVPSCRRYFINDAHVTLERYLADRGKFASDAEWVRHKMGWRRSIGAADALGTISPFYYLYMLLSIFLILILVVVFSGLALPAFYAMLLFVLLLYRFPALRR